MPIYEYACEDCGCPSSSFFPTFAAAQDARPTCPDCGSPRLGRLVSRVAFHQQRDLVERLSDERISRGFDPDDPRLLGRWARATGEATGVDLGPSWEDTVRQLESADTAGTVEVAPPGGFPEPGPDALPDAAGGD